MNRAAENFSGARGKFVSGAPIPNFSGKNFPGNNRVSPTLPQPWHSQQLYPYQISVLCPKNTTNISPEKHKYFARKNDWGPTKK
jgi:hypothetical protein